MDIRLASCSLFLHLLILLGARASEGRELITDNWSKHENNQDKTLAPGGNILLRSYENDEKNDEKHHQEDYIPKETSILRLHSMNVHENNDNSKKLLDFQQAVAGAAQIRAEHGQGHSSSHMNHMDPSVIVFFLLDDLKQGKTMPIWFPKRDPSSSPRLLPKEEADNIPFSLQSLQNLLQLFSFSQGSPQAKAMEDTLRECEVAPVKGETKFCATSLESMLDFVQQIFGTATQIKVLSTSHLTESAGGLQTYTILKEPEEIVAPKMVACHTMPYAYAVFYCHYQTSKSKIFKVSLSGEHGDRVEAVAVCHMDTSQWSRNHVSFSVLGIEPGSSPVCHFFPADNFVWIPTTLSLVM